MEPKLVDLSATFVNLAGCGVGDEVVVCLSEALATNQNVVDVDLSGNNITDVGAEHLASMLRRNRVLKYLNLSRNALADDGVRWIAQALRWNKSLSVLSLSSNPFGDRGVADLAKALTANETIQELVLLDCNMTCDGAVALAQHLHLNTSLLYLSLPFTMGYRLIGEINTILRHNWLRAGFVKQSAKSSKASERLRAEKEQSRRKMWRTPKPPPSDAPGRNGEFSSTQLPSQSSQWLDKSLGATMMYLHLLDKTKPRRPRKTPG
ncbi:FERM domain-containing protein C [Diplonema papillatum]|nr:FERM domain-containing protein C [Diplonema papillatum]KAJ9449694.1 FERM domain-containing protein C [Diplonema papillatum]